MKRTKIFLAMIFNLSKTELIETFAQLGNGCTE